MSLVVEYEFDDKGQDMVGGLRFEDMIAYRFRNEMHSQGFEALSYDTVVEVIDSDWIEGLARVEPKGIRDLKGKKHFAVLLSSNGYLEVIADFCTEIDQRSGNLS